MRNGWLIVAGVLDLAAAAMHVGVIVGGAAWYRFFGAGEAMAHAAETGSVVPALVTMAIVAVLTLWALYAFSAAGLIRRLPLVRTALVAITGIYLVRGLVPLPMLLLVPQRVDRFVIVSSLIVLGYGAVHAIGTRRAWRRLRPVATGAPAS